ncbi:MAG: glycogen/starch/alpha-glucan phosphorylase [Lachnospiraceae bacterium]|nr:glycogen/starch/alpha-glucan phosphorylase [Lachnospiraceae bacterium]
MADFSIDKELLRKRMSELVKLERVEELCNATEEQIYRALGIALKEQIIDAWNETAKKATEQDLKTVYYMSMEFLMGRALGNNLINLGAQPEVRELLNELGVDLNVIEDQERDWALGNGGLGRLAACFLYSLATLGYPAYGCGIRYKYGMFRQVIENGFQKEVPDVWLKNGNPFEVRLESRKKEVHFGGYTRGELDDDGRVHFIHEGYYSILAVPYDMPVIGYRNGVINSLRIWSAEPLEELELKSFDQGDYAQAASEKETAETICKVLYPNDNHYKGKELRLKQQYFFVSATLQRAVEKYMETHDDIHRLSEKVVFQMNDTHPTVAVAELMRILLDDYRLEWDEAWEITRKSCAYTNHTIMAEALEQWPIDLFSRLLPRVYQIVDEINRRFVAEIRRRYPGNEEKVRKMAILYDGRIRMANMAIAGGFSVNGVARLHTEILKKKELKDFYEMMPEKFNNKTNGITQRRFLLHGNPLQAAWVTERIGDGWITDLSQMEKLIPYADDPAARASFRELKYRNKLRLAQYILENNGIVVDPDSIFDVQVKRLHEYKRQLLNILHVMYLYNKLSDFPDRPIVPRTFIFGGKASSGYRLAKLTIKLINNVADLINNDSRIGGKLKVVFIEDYRVSNAEMIFAAADVSEQISTASKEASGTGNMKFMLNGALTLGTMDGANVEIIEEVGAENAFIFGMSADEVIAHEKNNDYDPMQIFRDDQGLRRVLQQLVNGFYSPEDPDLFRPLYDSLLTNRETGRADTYFNLLDFRSYEAAQRRVGEAYLNQEWWSRAAILNIAHCGKFSSDRTIQEYVDDIWHLEKIKL